MLNNQSLYCTSVKAKGRHFFQVMSCCCLLYCLFQAFLRKGSIDHTDTDRRRPGKENTHSTEQDSDTQDANMKDAPSCEKCEKIFPWNQRHLLWKHIQECTGPAESSESVPKATPLVARVKTRQRSTLPRYTGSSTTKRRSGESDSQAAATYEDAHKYEKCGRTFPWNQLQLRWKHKCEPTEVAHALEHGVRTEIDDATLTCKCGKSFPENQRRKFVRHKMQCSPRATLRAKRHRATLAQMLSTTKTPGKHH